MATSSTFACFLPFFVVETSLPACFSFTSSAFGALTMSRRRRIISGGHASHAPSALRIDGCGTYCAQIRTAFGVKAAGTAMAFTWWLPAEEEDEGGCWSPPRPLRVGRWPANALLKLRNASTVVGSRLIDLTNTVSDDSLMLMPTLVTWLESCGGAGPIGIGIGGGGIIQKLVGGCVRVCCRQSANP